MACHGNSTDMSCFCLHILYCTVLYPVTAWLGYDATIQIIFGRVSSPVEEYYIRIANFFSLSKFSNRYSNVLVTLFCMIVSDLFSFSRHK